MKWIIGLVGTPPVEGEEKELAIGIYLTIQAPVLSLDLGAVKSSSLSMDAPSIFSVGTNATERICLTLTSGSDPYRPTLCP